MCFLVAKLIRRNLSYSYEKVLKLALSNVEMKKIPGYYPRTLALGGGKRNRGQGFGGRGWGGRGEESGREGEGGEGMEGGKVKLGENPPPL